MSGIDSLIKDFYTLRAGLVPRNLDKIYIDRRLSENAIITNYYTRYLGKGRFSDLIKSDLDHVFAHQAPQLRPIIGSLGGGKSTLVTAIERIAREKYGDHAAIVKINMSDFHTIDPESLTRAVYQEIVIQLKPYLKSMIKEAGDKSYTPYFITPETIANLCSEDRSVAEKAFRSLLGSDKSSKEEIPYIIKGLNEFIVNLFSNTNRILIILYDEVDIFVKLNKDKYPSTIDSFTYTFLRDFTDPRLTDRRPIYVVFTCEREMYEYIKSKCENFYRVAYNHEIIMKQFSDEELFELADKIYENIIAPIFENRVRISQLPKDDIQGIIDRIKARPLLNETIPGYFIKDYLDEFTRRYELDFDDVINASKAYEERAFDEFKEYLNRMGGWAGFTRNKVVQGYNFDGYAEMLERGIPVRRAYGEFTMSTASPEKVEKFIGWLSNLEKAGQFRRENGDAAIFISPGISPKAKERAEAYGLIYIQFLNGGEVVKPPKDRYSSIKGFIKDRYKNASRRKFKRIVEEVKGSMEGAGEEDIRQAIIEMIKEGVLKAKGDSIAPDTFISFNL